MGQEYGDKWYVSWHNFAGSDGKNGERRIVIHDTTLRDGEQQAGVVFSADEKVEIAKALARLGVDRIEAGMVAVSEEDRTAIAEITRMKLGPEIWTIARSIPKDVELAIESGVDGVGVILLANEQYCEIFDWTLEEALEKAITAAGPAMGEGLATTMLIADSPRMSRERLEKVVTTASASGVFSALALMDTFGTLDPVGTEHLVRTVKGLTSLPIELHPHNDFGLGTANALAGVAAGAAVVHTSVLGLGERVGNTALEEFAVAGALLRGYQHQLKLDEIQGLADLVGRCARVSMSPNKAIVGASYSQVESGTVASEVTRWTGQNRDLQWLFPFAPEVVGRAGIEVVVGKGSGIANIESVAAATGLDLTSEEKRELLQRAKVRAAQLHRVLSTEEVVAIAKEIQKET